MLCAKALLLVYFLTSVIAGGYIESSIQSPTQTPSPNPHPVGNFAQRNLNTLQKIYDLTTFPHNVPIIQEGGNAVPPGLFNVNATGRVSPAGNFTGFNDSIEYFFSIAPVPSQPTFLAFSEAQIVEFQSGCPEMASSVVYLRTAVFNPDATNNGQAGPTIKHVAFWRFDDQGAVLAYDAWIPNLNPWALQLAGVPKKASPEVTAVTQSLTIQSICSRAQERCVGDNTQYGSVEQCIDTLTAKPFGNLDEAWSDSVVCRSIHILLTLVRPEVHCTHVGPTGGMKCVDVDYETAYFVDEPLFGEPEGQTFICP